MVCRRVGPALPSVLCVVRENVVDLAAISGCALPRSGGRKTPEGAVQGSDPVTSDSSSRPLSARRILIVDDQPSIWGVLEVALSEAGADVWTASNGPAALDSLVSTIPDLILLDLVMPGMNGWQVIEALTNSPRTAAIPVVLQTSAEDFASFDRARKKGVAAFISKPFRLSEVIETCRRITEGARPLQGTSTRGDSLPSVAVRSSAGELIAVGYLLDLSLRGAQIDLEIPLALAQRIHLTLDHGGTTETRLAEVRWMTRVGVRFHHGLFLRAE